MGDTILIPTDTSELSTLIIEPVLKLLLAREAEVLLLHVAEEGARADPGHDPDVATAHLDDVRERLTLAGVQASTRIEYGDPTERILAVASEVEPYLLAMATHGRSGLVRFARGSVAERVLRLCPVPLLTGNPGTFTPDFAFHRLLVPLDGSEVADGILPLVEELGGAFHSEVTLLCVQPLTELHAVDRPENWDPKPAVARLDAQRARLEKAGLKVSVEASLGPPAAMILEASARSDLVAMSTHGRSGVARWWFGSVAETVLRSCDRPLLVRRVRAPYLTSDLAKFGPLA